MALSCKRKLNNFNPLPSCEGRRDFVHPVAQAGVFQSTPLMRGETGRARPDVDG